MNAAAPMTGILVADKPAGWSSMDVVRRIRGAAGGVKTGHAGTLDPLATGVLLCCLGRATRSVERLMGLGKVYEARVDLSAFSETDDREGPLEPVAVERFPSREQIRAALRRFEGTIEQVPPAFSAIKTRGRRAYALARGGERPKLEPRRVRIDELALVACHGPCLELRIACGRGTYIRALARDLGRALGTGGHLAALRRTAIGPYTIEQAADPRTLERLTPGDLLEAPGPGG